MKMIIFPNKLVRLARLTTEQEISIHLKHWSETRCRGATLFNIVLTMPFQQAQCNLIGTKYIKNHTVLSYAEDIATLHQSKAHKRDF